MRASRGWNVMDIREKWLKQRALMPNVCKITHKSLDLPLTVAENASNVCDLLILRGLHLEHFQELCCSSTVGRRSKRPLQKPSCRSTCWLNLSL